MTTFVTAFLDLHEDRSQDKSYDTCFQHFHKLLENTHLFFVVYLSKRFVPQMPSNHPRVTLIVTELEELETWSTLQHCSELPSKRTDYHDTKNFMTLMNSKVELVAKAIHLNPYKHSQFAWIDFSICHIFKQLDNSFSYLDFVAASQWKPGVIMPGCWSRGQEQENLFQKINWRFCGGFFLGDRESLLDFYNKNCQLLSSSSSGRLTWEVNMWHLVELQTDFRPLWYKANHDDSIVHIPTQYLSVVASFTTIPSRIVTNARKTIDSLLGQVEHIYISIPETYKRFSDQTISIPPYFNEPPYSSHVTIVRMPIDKGPASKYLGPLDLIAANQWIFFCDDDQEYHPLLVGRMKHAISTKSAQVYQNRYHTIGKKTSGGHIHGYVGNLILRSSLDQLASFEIPECAKFVDDQWMSIYCALHNIQVMPTAIENYGEIFKTTLNGFELIGPDSLASLGNRDQCVKQLENYFHVKFVGPQVKQLQIEKFFYINLDSRPDKNKDTIAELERAQIKNYERFSAIRNNNGAIGCSESHIAILKLIKTRYPADYHLRYFAILEDDFSFHADLSPNECLQQALSVDFDVILLASNTIRKQPSAYPFLDRCIEAQTTAGYIFAGHYLDTLLQNFEEGVALFKSGHPHWIVSIDQYWKRLQPKDKWFIFNPRLGYQRAAISDLSNQWVDPQKRY